MNAWESDYRSKQGNIGLGAAIAYYTSKGLSISLPLNDTQKYDLIVDEDGKLSRVSVKTTRQIIKSGKFIVQLRNTGGSSGKSKSRNFENTSCDKLFILTKEGTMYEIPSNNIEVKIR